MKPHEEETWVGRLRQQFPALARRDGQHPTIYFDGPAGTQVPQRVVDAVTRGLVDCNANLGGRFTASRECVAAMERAHSTFADFVNAGRPDEIIFGPNTTTLTLALSRAISSTWSRSDEIIVSALDHDANVTPWVLAARDRNVTVREIPVRTDDCTLDMAAFNDMLSERTRLVAVGGASNSVGTRNPISEICSAARDVGALTYVDAVHYAPHVAVDVRAIGCDFLVCSAYKFFGPHVGILWGRFELLDDLTPYKVRPAPSAPPGKWMTGTQNHPCIAGASEAVEYLADSGRQLAGSDLPRRDALRQMFDWIEAYERRLARKLLDGLSEIPQITVSGIVDRSRDNERFATVSISHATAKPIELAEYLGASGVATWHGNYYALRLSECLGREPEGMLRIGLVHYNTPDEVDQLLTLLGEFTPKSRR